MKQKQKQAYDKVLPAKALMLSSAPASSQEAKNTYNTHTQTGKPTIQYRSQNGRSKTVSDRGQRWGPLFSYSALDFSVSPHVCAYKQPLRSFTFEAVNVNFNPSQARSLQVNSVLIYTFCRWINLFLLFLFINFSPSSSHLWVSRPDGHVRKQIHTGARQYCSYTLWNIL